MVVADEVWLAAAIVRFQQGDGTLPQLVLGNSCEGCGNEQPGYRNSLLPDSYLYIWGSGSSKCIEAMSSIDR